MLNIKINDFVSRYEPLYYKPESCPDSYKLKYYGAKEGLEERYKHLLKEILNIANLKSTDFYAEANVMELLKSSTFNKLALAWKAGKVYWNNKIITTDDFEQEKYFINGYGGHIDKDAFQKYCDNLKNEKETINKFVEDERWKDAYKVVTDISPKNIGPVYNINTLFFITGGKSPIYDAYAHKAIKALLFDISPSEVYLGGNPEKNEIGRVASMYQEYMIILKIIFRDWFKVKKKNDMFIPRELDRALWVYGHSQKKHDK